MDIKLDIEGDISITAGDLVMIEGVNAIGQDIACRCKTVRGEWILDALNGIPYFEYIWVQSPNRMVIDYLFRQTIMQTAGVSSVTALNLDFEKTTRKLIVSPTVVADTGEVLVFTDLVLEVS